MYFEKQYKSLGTHHLMSKTVGIIAISLSFCLVASSIIFFGAVDIESSISHYYYTPVRNVFVSALSATAFYFYVYKGYTPSDNILANWAGIFAILVAWIPTSPTGTKSILGYIHLGFASAFFFILFIFLTFFFTRSDKGVKPTKMKLLRNRIYRTCGLIVIFSLIGMLFYFFIKDKTSLPRFIFFAETVALMAVGVGWIVKAGVWFNDK